MKKKYTINLTLTAIIVFFQMGIYAQEFPIAVGPDTTFSGGAVYGGEHGIVAVQGDNNSQYSINAQLVAAGGILLGPRISLGAEGIFPGAIPIFDGTNYFLVWCGFDSVLKGQFINTSGNLVGSSFSIAGGVSIARNGLFNLALGDDSILVVYVKKTGGYVYGRLVDRSDANVVGSEIKISDNSARELSIAYDGTNYLVAWVEQIQGTDKNIYGQFVSKSGALVGSNFVVDDGPYYSDNPISLAYDGTRYLLAFHETTNSESETFVKWQLLGRFITTSGTIAETITICDSLMLPFLPSVDFDGNNYFITWTQFSNSSMMGQFFTTLGTAIGTPFVVFGPVESKVPIGGVGFGGGQYLAVATKVDSNFTDGDVYGRFISPLTEIKDEENLIPQKTALFQNYPNPFNPITVIRYQLPVKGYVSLKVFNVLGQEVAVLVDEIQEAGYKAVNFDSGRLPSGIYIYRIAISSEGNLFKSMRKMMLLR